MSTITKERVAQIIHAAGLEPCDYEEVFESIKTGEIVAMARIALASLTAEPVAWTDADELRDANNGGSGYLFSIGGDANKFADHRSQIMLFTAPPAPVVPTFDEWLEVRGNKPLGWVKDAMRESYDACRAAMLQGSQPVSNREKVRREHAEWSDATFGNVGPMGPLKHLSKEALEAAAEPYDLSEWADMQFLLWDAQRRAGISDGEITAAMEEKLEINKARQWPEPKDGEPRQHIKEPPYPILPGDLIKGAAMIQGGK
ncbi:TPA: DUF550 domain-containing protein [Citrobacter amalonaticus]